MIKLLAYLLIFFFLTFQPVLAVKTNVKSNNTVPKWEDYIPEKYHYPRSDFKRKSAYWELGLGFFLTDLIITAPIGIPMVYHSATKIKNISYADKKAKFEKGLIYASSIQNLNLRNEYYTTLLKECKMTERKKNALAKKRARKLAKEQAKKEKETLKNTK